MSISIKMGVSLVAMALLLIAPMGALDAGPLATRDITAEWYFPEWLGTSPYAPSFQVRDTINKYGRYAKKTKIITLKDLIKFHGHFCGGLVESSGACGWPLTDFSPTLASYTANHMKTLWIPQTTERSRYSRPQPGAGRQPGDRPDISSMA